MNQTALITGASTGIGKELAIVHASKGRDLVLVARREELLQNLKELLVEKYGVEVKIYAMDLTTPGTLDTLMESLSNDNISVDYLFNNAGFGGRGEFIKREWEKDRSMIDLNIRVLTELTRLILPGMVERGFGKILQVSSTAAFVPGPDMAVYYASKAYVLSFSHAIACECEGTGVTVTALCPGATATEFAKVSDMAGSKGFKKTVTAEKVAKDAYNGMEKGKLTVISGFPWIMKMSLAFRSLMPVKLILKAAKEFQNKR